MATATQEKKNLFNNLKEKIQDKSEPVIQKQIVAPKQKKEKAAEQLFSFYIQSEKLTALKIKAAADNTSIKELINNALVNYYNI